MDPLRSRRLRASTWWAAVIAAVVVHVAVLGTVHAVGLSWLTVRRMAPSAHRAAVPSDEVDLATTCAGDVALATSGRAALCLAPWIADVDQCLADAQMSLWIDLSGCEARNDPRVAIEIVEPKIAARLPEIDPERLLEDSPAKVAMVTPPPPQIMTPPPPPPPPPQQPRAQQVIETVKPAKEEEPTNARFVSEFNTRAEKEKVSRGARNEPMVAKAKPESLPPKDKPADEPSVKPHEDRVVGMNEHAPEVPGTLSMRNPGAMAPALSAQELRTRGAFDGMAGPTSPDGIAAHKGDGAIAQDRRDRSELPNGDSGAGGGAPQAPILSPSRESLERALGGGSVDRLDNVEDGDETSLNSKRWIYASFFNRLKRQVAQNWDPQSVWRRADPRGTVYGIKSRYTGVRVSLSRSGEVENILVTDPSGVMVLDDEAVRAFRASGPFPNPPEGLMQNNQITFQFGFSFGIGEPKVSWRLPTAM